MSIRFNSAAHASASAATSPRTHSAPLSGSSVIVTAVFALGVLCLLAGVYAFETLRAAPGDVEIAAPDWSSTRSRSGW